MEHHQYSLTKRGKTTCPMCEHKTFVLYIDTNTGKPLHETVGKCDRADNCGHHYTPKQYFSDNNISFDKKEYTPPPKPTPEPPPSFIDTELMKKSLSNYKSNTLVTWLAKKFGTETVTNAINRYHVGTSKNGGAIFWQIDLKGKIRTGKIIQYDTAGHRRKDVTPPVKWVHGSLKLQNYNLQQCLFGEHLLKDTTKDVGIVESEKTAIIASLYLPNIIWLAAGNVYGLGAKGNVDKLRCLKGRKVVLYPDASLHDKTGKTAFEKWSEKAKELSVFCSVKVSDLVEKHATEQERSAGFDIADYLIKTPFTGQIKQPEPPPIQKPQPIEKTANIKAEISELETILKSRKYPEYPIKLDQCTTVTNAEAFIGSGLLFLKNNQKRLSNGFMPTLHRLQRFEQITRV